MLSRLVQGVSIAVVVCASRLGRAVKRLLRPVRPAAALAVAASLDVFQPSSRGGQTGPDEAAQPE